MFHWPHWFRWWEIIAGRLLGHRPPTRDELAVVNARIDRLNADRAANRSRLLSVAPLAALLLVVPSMRCDGPQYPTGCNLDSYWLPSSQVYQTIMVCEQNHDYGYRIEALVGGVWRYGQWQPNGRASVVHSTTPPTQYRPGYLKI